MVRHGLFEITVNSPGIGALPEYDDPNPARELKDIRGLAVARYIEAVAGAEFSLKLKIDAGFEFSEECDVICFDIDAGADIKEGVLMFEEDIDDADGREEELSGRRFLNADRTETIQKFLFNALQVTESVNFNDTSTKVTSQTGSLRVVVTRRKVVGEVAWEKYQQKQICEPQLVKLASESDVKGRALDLESTLAEPTSSDEEHSVWHTDKVEGDPLLTVIFKYRTRAGLVSEGVIDESSGPSSPVNNDADVDGNQVNDPAPSHATTAASTEPRIKQEVPDEPSRKRERSPSGNVRDKGKSTKGEDRGYLFETFKKVRLDVEAMTANRDATPVKMEKQKNAVLRKLDFLQSELFGDLSDSDNEESSLRVKEEKDDAIEPGAANKDVMEISDDDDA